jgi:hypothetical protein
MEAMREHQHPADQEHLKEWLRFAGEPVWNEIVSKMGGGEPPQVFRFLNFQRIINHGLWARTAAEIVDRDNVDPIYQSKLALHNEMLRCADAAELLAKYYAEIKASAWSQKLKELLEREAPFFRELAGAPPQPTIHISRQRRGRRRPQSRIYHACMSHLISKLRSDTGQPFYGAVVTMTNVAFPEADVTEEDARGVWRAMSGKRLRPRKSGTLDR